MRMQGMSLRQRRARQRLAMLRRVRICFLKFLGGQPPRRPVLLGHETEGMKCFVNIYLGRWTTTLFHTNKRLFDPQGRSYTDQWDCAECACVLPPCYQRWCAGHTNQPVAAPASDVGRLLLEDPDAKRIGVEAEEGTGLGFRTPCCPEELPSSWQKCQAFHRVRPG